MTSLRSNPLTLNQHLSTHRISCHRRPRLRRRNLCLLGDLLLRGSCNPSFRGSHPLLFPFRRPLKHRQPATTKNLRLLPSTSLPLRLSHAKSTVPRSPILHRFDLPSPPTSRPLNLLHPKPPANLLGPGFSRRMTPHLAQNQLADLNVFQDKPKRARSGEPASTWQRPNP